MEQIKELESLVSEINKTFDDIREKKIEIKKEDRPSNLSIMLSGVSDSRALDFLFSSNLDKTLEKLFLSIQNGDFEKNIADSETLQKILSRFGFGEGSFRGEISQTVLKSLEFTTQSLKFQKMKSNIKKAILVLSDLKKQAAKFKDDPEKKKKYEDAVYAVKKLLIIAAKIYRNRRLVNQRVFAGLNNIVNEDMDAESLIKIEG